MYSIVSSSHTVQCIDRECFSRRWSPFITDTEERRANHRRHSDLASYGPYCTKTAANTSLAKPVGFERNRRELFPCRSAALAHWEKHDNLLNDYSELEPGTSRRGENGAYTGSLVGYSDIHSLVRKGELVEDYHVLGHPSYPRDRTLPARGIPENINPSSVLNEYVPIKERSDVQFTKRSWIKSPKSVVGISGVPQTDQNRYRSLSFEVTSSRSSVHLPPRHEFLHPAAFSTKKIFSAEHSRSQSLNESMLQKVSNEDTQKTKPRSRSFDTFENKADSIICSLCKISLTSKELVDEHFQSTKHKNRIAKVTADPYLKFCEYCKVHLNSKSQAQEHFASTRHAQTMAKSQKAPIRLHPRLTITTDPVNIQFNTRTCPSGYHIELFTKALANNSVCFLPTGADKTLVAALIIAHLLQLNPSRQVVFLVDRVLLVLQQSDFLRTELSHVAIPTSTEGKMPFARQPWQRFRPIRVGAICGEMRRLEPGVPVFDHDVLVVTADCYKNHINNGTLRFEDLALIVLDEAHHCNKEHPYNVIIRDYYLCRKSDAAPMVLGLVSSLAGEMTTDRTVKKLERLLCNLGGAGLLTVTEETSELDRKARMKQLTCYLAEYTLFEQKFVEALMEYATRCFNLAARVTELKEYKELFQPPAGGTLSSDDVQLLLRVSDNILASAHPDDPPLPLQHFVAVCECICTLQECGEGVAADQIVALDDVQCAFGFYWADGQGLQSASFKTCLTQGSSTSAFSIDSAICELLRLLLSQDWARLYCEVTPVVLVLTKRRLTACLLAKQLDENDDLRNLEVVTTYAVNDEPNIKPVTAGLFQIVVAVCPAGEAPKIRNCKMVVQMEPASAVSALNHMRCCSHYEEAIFAAICRDQERASHIHELIQREENMARAAQILGSVRQ
ncbi:uncharacterized protein LOC116604124 isoform X2 [Nematostella vectensis]|nr:uncharacterized protein LOC116604124 isoform X2 [Nematostella vectensis]XP_032221945.2 uncharacterized protein LOC116604124 isoform X2 [Nematostella vectensis]XP_048582738.1 uncharacterized protein LOC116604124 isoform X2 [Nematostella vectensis]